MRTFFGTSGKVGVGFPCFPCRDGPCFQRDDRINRFLFYFGPRVDGGNTGRRTTTGGGGSRIITLVNTGRRYYYDYYLLYCADYHYYDDDVFVS